MACNFFRINSTIRLVFYKRNLSSNTKIGKQTALDPVCQPLSCAGLVPVVDSNWPFPGKSNSPYPPPLTFNSGRNGQSSLSRHTLVVSLPTITQLPAISPLATDPSSLYRPKRYSFARFYRSYGPARPKRNLISSASCPKVLQ